MHGSGTLRIEDGRVYSGEFYRGRIQGFGVMEYPDGNIYEGEFKNGVREGYGYNLWHEGRDSYQGWWHQDKQHGLGTFKANQEDDARFGLWQMGYRVQWLTEI